MAWVWTALLIGVLHAGFSFYWAVGGTGLLDTVGAWVVELRDREPLAATVGLSVVGAVKLAAAAVPVAMAYDRIPWIGLWRSLSWAGSTVLVVYGLANTVAADLVLVHVIVPGGGLDLRGLAGHAWLWDPLFLLWGIALFGYLWRSRGR